MHNCTLICACIFGKASGPFVVTAVDRSAYYQRHARADQFHVFLPTCPDCCLLAHSKTPSAASLIPDVEKKKHSYMKFSSAFLATTPRRIAYSRIMMICFSIAHIYIYILIHRRAYMFKMHTCILNFTYILRKESL